MEEWPCEKEGGGFSAWLERSGPGSAETSGEIRIVVRTEYCYSPRAGMIATRLEDSAKAGELATEAEAEPRQKKALDGTVGGAATE